MKTPIQASTIFWETFFPFDKQQEVKQYIQDQKTSITMPSQEFLTTCLENYIRVKEDCYGNSVSSDLSSNADLSMLSNTTSYWVVKIYTEFKHFAYSKKHFKIGKFKFKNPKELEDALDDIIY